MLYVTNNNILPIRRLKLPLPPVRDKFHYYRGGKRVRKVTLSIILSSCLTRESYLFPQNGIISDQIIKIEIFSIGFFGVIHQIIYKISSTVTFDSIV